jgi:hypothetical protein
MATQEEHSKVPVDGGQSRTPKQTQRRYAGANDTNSNGAEDVQAARKYTAPAAARTPRSDQSLPARHCAPGHVNRQGPYAKRLGTHGRSDRTEDANAEHKRTTKATGEPDQRAPGHAPQGGTRHDRTKDDDSGGTQAKRPPTHRRPPQAPQQNGSPGTGTDHATRTENQGNRGPGTQRMRTQAMPTSPRPTSTKNTGTAKRPKNKYKTDGSWRQAIEARKVASPETTIGARSTLTKPDQAR